MSLGLLSVGALACVSSMAVLWVVAQRMRNYSIVDIGWSAHFALLAAIYGAGSSGWLPRRWVFGGMTALWSVRLAMHLARRIIGEPEEGRYVQLRREWGAKGDPRLKFLGFFQLQAALNVFLALPLLVACANPTPRWHPLEWAGFAVWLCALVGEAVADRQLAAFKSDVRNRGAVCDVGLWRYSRHPNYFFEWLVWVAYALFALASPPWGYIAPLMPALMLHFLLNVTGIRATEEQALRSRGDAYRRYQERTSAFVPWFVRRGATQAPPGNTNPGNGTVSR